MLESSEDAPLERRRTPPMQIADQREKALRLRDPLVDWPPVGWHMVAPTTTGDCTFGMTIQRRSADVHTHIVSVPASELGRFAGLG
jgi:hypothetical protein